MGVVEFIFWVGCWLLCVGLFGYWKVMCLEFVGFWSVDGGVLDCSWIVWVCVFGVVCVDVIGVVVWFDGCLCDFLVDGLRLCCCVCCWYGVWVCCLGWFEYLCRLFYWVLEWVVFWMLVV